jgi:hypothetical protein
MNRLKCKVERKVSQEWPTKMAFLDLLWKMESLLLVDAEIWKELAEPNLANLRAPTWPQGILCMELGDSVDGGLPSW